MDAGIVLLHHLTSSFAPVVITMAIRGRYLTLTIMGHNKMLPKTSIFLARMGCVYHQGTKGFLTVFLCKTVLHSSE